MRISSRVLSARAHTPLIHFLGKRTWPPIPEAQHVHPAAPPELRKSFDEFLKRFQGPSREQSTPSKDHDLPLVYQEFWEAPKKYWKPRGRELSEEEIEVVLSGGAS